VSSTVPAAPVPVAPTAAPRAGTRRRFSRRRLARRVALNAVALLVFAVMIFPVYWMVATAFKRGQDVFSYTPVWFPVHATLSNFSDAIHRPHFWDSVKSSLIIVSVVVLLSLLLAFLAALALAKFRFYGRKAFIVLIIAVQMVPLNALIIPIFLVLSKANQVDKLSGVIITYMTFVLPFTIWTLRGFMLGVPRELEEAAMVDGSTRFGAFVRILLPLVGPGLVATSIFAFIQAWNEFVMAYVLLRSPEKQTLTVWLASFTTARGTAWGSLMAGATLTALPVVIFFVAIQRKIAFGLTAGAVRG
jgi:N,N'-diacetylchitobiose transport system permease protein